MQLPGGGSDTSDGREEKLKTEYYSPINRTKRTEGKPPAGVITIRQSSLSVEVSL